MVYIYIYNYTYLSLSSGLLRVPSLMVDSTTYSYIYLSSSDPLRVPSLMVDRVTNSAVEYQVGSTDAITDAVITGYEVTRFGVPMIGQYVNTGRGRRVTISPAVPGAQYRITAWALDGSYDGRRSATPAVEYVTTREARETCMYKSVISMV